jgi:hypothetical protein
METIDQQIDQAADELRRLHEIVGEQRLTIEALMMGTNDTTTPVIKRIDALEAENGRLRKSLKMLLAYFPSESDFEQLFDDEYAAAACKAYDTARQTFY